jgi:hypothetical protein
MKKKTELQLRKLIRETIKKQLNEVSDTDKIKKLYGGKYKKRWQGLIANLLIEKSNSYGDKIAKILNVEDDIAQEQLFELMLDDLSNIEF